MKTAVVPSPTPIVGMLLELDDGDPEIVPVIARRLAEYQGGEPASRAAADDDQLPDRPRHGRALARCSCPFPRPRPTSFSAPTVEYIPVVRNSVGLVPKKRRNTLAK